VRLTHPWAVTGKDRDPFGYYTDTRSEAFASWASVDYVRSAFTVTHPDTRGWFPPDMPAYPPETPAKRQTLEWTRQMLFLKDFDPAGPAYLVLRDSVRGGQPTVWQFWTLSEKLGTAAEAARAEEFLAEKPGRKILPARKLPPGDRYTALGQFGVDVEFFVAAPAATPRYTLRYGGVLYGRPEYQDLLHLRLPGDGAYYVVLFPRRREEKAPEFRALAGGRVIKVAGEFGTDYGFLSALETSAAEEGVFFRGTAGSVQDRKTGLVLALGAAGEVRYREYALAAGVGASLCVAPGVLVLEFAPEHPEAEVFVSAPGRLRIKDGAGLSLTELEAGRWGLRVPAGTRTVRLVRASD